MTIDLKLGWVGSTRLRKQGPIFENAITAPMRIGVMFLGLTDVKSAITCSRGISLSVDNVRFCLVKSAEETGSETICVGLNFWTICYDLLAPKGSWDSED